MPRLPRIDRQQVLDVAETIVVQHGAGQLTIDAVARAAGITKGGVQSCFGSKDQLVTALLQRWAGAWEAAKAKVAVPAGPDAAPLTPVQQHVRVTATETALNARAASLLAAVLQSPEQTAWLRAWYAGQLQPLDLGSDDGRRARLAFLATEGAFLLRYLGLARFDDAQWQDLFADIERCARPTDRPQENA